MVLFHTGYFLIPSVAPNLLPGGFLGVDLFFVLSGFLITKILLEREQSYGRFYLRRVARIFPALYVFLAVQFLYWWATGSGPASQLKAYAMIALGMGNWGGLTGIKLPFSLGQTWSLGVEEQMYVLWPLVIILFGRADARRIARVCIAGIAVSFVVKLLMFHAGVPTPHIYAQTGARLDDFLTGGYVATLWYRRISVAHVRTAMPFAAGVLVIALAVAHPYTSAWLYEGGFTAVAICVGVVLYACLHETAWTGIMSSAPLRAVGRYSYSIYLWHPLVFLAVFKAFPHDVWARVGAAAVLVTGVSVLSTRFVEEPLRRLAARQPRVVPAPVQSAVELVRR